MSDRKKLILFSMIEFVIFIGLGLTYCMMVSYLISIGYSATDRSYMYAAGAIVGMVSQFAIGYLCDKHHTIKKYVYIIFIGYVIASVLLYITTGQNFFVHLLLVAINIAMLRLAMGITDSWIIESGRVCKDNYGAVRAYGSVGWAIGSAIAAMLIRNYGYKYIGYGFALAIVLALIIAFFAPDAIKEKNVAVSFKDVGILFKNKGYCLLIAIFFAIFVVQTALDYTIVDKLTLLGASSVQVSNYWSLTAMVELPLFFLGGWLVKKFGTSKLLIFSASAYTVRMVLYGVSTTVGQMLAISVLQLVTFPVMMVVSKLLIDEESPEQLKSSGQQVGLSIYSATSALISPILSGMVEDSFGVNAAIYAITIFGVIAIALTFAYVKYKENVNKSRF